MWGKLLCAAGRGSRAGVLERAVRAAFCDWNVVLARPGFRTPAVTSLQPCVECAGPGTDRDGRHSNRKYSTSKSTVESDELEKFQALSQKWWDRNGEFAALHALNDLRVPFIRDTLLTHSERQQLGRPLCGFRILDVGCGGGLLSEPLGRLGAMVTGIDPLEDNIRLAEVHKSFDPVLKELIQYSACCLEEMAMESPGRFDAVIASEVVEHVGDVETFIGCAAQVLKPGGSLFITTINKTFLSYALAIVAAEKIFRIVPNGTHDWEKFISPNKLETHLISSGFTVETINGMLYNPLFDSWSWIINTSVNYALHAVKKKIEEKSDFMSEGSDRKDNGCDQSESNVGSTVQS
ncbi:ubiquinone biosynthesis O-methyltransferase, mitochondrial isoform X2 [Hemiscyllium ocellatum]|uniref:ubiquinone biosynthesis O-methyltransferase, mitochondrial isoform X2 n=1 Tax=Hemiscyllium ocellatum TaxID=170820 RepID=UPI002966FDE2|nr:ubiquinone biosynthesis O-methyltransferase, mitochondrial isoform X2 [Hemiscyllium ocellatum]